MSTPARAGSQMIARIPSAPCKSDADIGLRAWFDSAPMHRIWAKIHRGIHRLIDRGIHRVIMVALVFTVIPGLDGRAHAEKGAGIDATTNHIRDHFLPGGIPLMQGLAVRDEMMTVFDTPAGRIIEIIAFSDHSPDAVDAYYRGVLPHIGWIQAPSLAWSREDEILSIESKREDNMTVTYFLLHPEK